MSVFSHLHEGRQNHRSFMEYWRITAIGTNYNLMSDARLFLANFAGAPLTETAAST